MPPVSRSARTLIVAPATLTEAIQSQPLVASLRRLDPQGTIDVLAPPDVAAVYRAMSAVSTVRADGLPPDRLTPWTRAMLAAKLRRARYDRAYILQEGPVPTLVPWLAGISGRVGISDGRPRWQAQRGEPTGRRPRALSDRYAALACRPGDPPSPGLRPPVLDRPPAMSADLARQLGLEAGESPILLAPASELGPASEWPARHYAALAAQIAARWPRAVIGLIGRPRDRALTTQIAALSGQRLRNWAGLLDTAGMLSLIHRAASVVSSESSVMHLAAALMRPHVAIYGAGDPRAERVADNRRQVLWLRLDCGPCNAAHCRLGHLNCLNRQSPEAVFAALQKTLRFSATAR